MNSLMMAAQPVKYRGTITGLLISGVDGTAFIDASNASVTALADGNHSIEVYDSSGRFIRGVLSAAGSAETVDVELVTNGDMELDANWPNYATPETNERSNVQAHGGTYSRHIIDSTASYGGCAQNVVVTQHSLYKIVSSLYVISGNARSRLYNSGIGQIAAYDVSSPGSWLTGTKYATPIASSGYEVNVINPSNTIPCEFYADDLSLKQVLTPSSSGATIVSTKGGAVQNWAYKNASFTYNQASYTVVIRDLRGRALNLSTTGTSPRISAVDDTAFVDNLPAGITAFADGKHYLRVYDPAGKYIEGVLSEVGSAETLDADLLSGFDFTSGWGIEGLAAVVDANSYSVTSGNAGVSKSFAAINYTGLYKSVLAGSTTCSQFYLRETIGGIMINTGAGTGYVTWSNSSNNVLFHRSSNAGQTDITTSTFQKVLTPSSSGAVIVNTISGAVDRWITKETGFDYNNAGTYTFQVWSQY